MNIDNLPFYYKTLEKKNSSYPETMPFNLVFDEELLMYRQVTNVELKNTLQKIYKEGSLVEGSLSNESGDVYVSKILEYLDSNINLEKKSLLEIGCGDGTMLAEFDKHGAFVLGIEPGTHKNKVFSNRIKIIRDFFPSQLIDGEFDIIFSYGVLEHIEEPVQFIINQKKYLKEDGKIIICVPNIEPCLIAGDISMFIHEHFNYFTSESLSKTINMAGLFVDSLIEIEGVLLAIVSYNDKSKYRSSFQLNKKKFEKGVDKLISQLKTKLSTYEESDIAVYPAMRALNYMAILGMKNCRLIDDNTQLHNKYLPYTNKTIESFQQLISAPPKLIVIFSRTFGQRIKDKCNSHPRLQNTKIITLDE